MGFLDKFTEILRDNDEDEFDDFYDENPGYSMPAPPKREKHKSVRVPKEEKPEKIHRTRAESDKVVNIHTTAQLQVVLVKPERFEEAAAIGDNLNEKRTVVLNLESTNRDIARRLLDFLSGVAYANGGKVKRVATRTFIITPYNVDLTGDDLIDELEGSGVYF